MNPEKICVQNCCGSMVAQYGRFLNKVKFLMQIYSSQDIYSIYSLLFITL